MTRVGPLGRCCAAIFLVLVLPLMPHDDATASTNRRIVIDPFTGLAIHGFDPVAYFVNGKALQGEPQYEALWQGVTWRFINSGNKAAFLDAPEVYGPRYGGYGVVSLARGKTAAGKPVYFALHKGKLYFFYSPSMLHIWRNDPDGFIEQAERNWDSLRKKLAR